MKTSFFATLFLLTGLTLAIHRKGVLELDQLTFDKIVSDKFYSLVYFQEQSWKDPSGYEKVGEEFGNNPDVLIAKVDGNENKDLVSRFGIEKLPAFRFFSKKSTPEIYTGGDSADELIEYVRSATNPLFSELKDLARSFAASAKKVDLLKKAETLVKGFSGPDAELGKLYIKNMEQIQKSGADFVEKEAKRLQGLIDNPSTTKQKKQEFGKRLNLLNAFKAEAK